jgi:hypothetical protein
MHQPSGVAVSGTGPFTMTPLITPLWGDYCAGFLVAFRLLMQVVVKLAYIRIYQNCLAQESAVASGPNE